ncbi:hypothetical protein D3C76_1814890 [compost metagenome]
MLRLEGGGRFYFAAGAEEVVQLAVQVRDDGVFRVGHWAYVHRDIPMKAKTKSTTAKTSVQRVIQLATLVAVR